MAYIIRRTNQGGGWVAWSGDASYTKHVLRARLYPTLAAAQAACCGNEVIEPAYEQVSPWPKVGGSA